MKLKDTVHELTQDEDVSLWIDNLQSASAKRIYAEGLARFTQYLELSPKEIVAFFHKDQTQGEKRLQAFVVSYSEKLAPKTLNNLLVGVKSWLRHNDVAVKRKINVGNTRLTPTLDGEAPPSQAEVGRILVHSDVRGKTAISLIGFADLRPETAVKMRLKDLPELSIQEENVKISKMPAIIMVGPQFSKNGRGYFTFLIEEGCNYLVEYLKLRVRNGEKLNPESPLIRESAKGGRMTFGRKGFSKLIKRIFTNAGFKGRPYVLRAFFDTAIMNARTVPYEYQHFWMGHSGTIEATYTVNKRLPAWQIEEMRKVFREAVEPHLRTSTTETSLMAQFALDFKQDMLLSIGFTEQEVARMNLSEMKREEFQRLLQEKRTRSGASTHTTTLQNGGERTSSIQKVVTVDEVDQCLDKGWKFVSALNKKKVILQF